MSLWALFRHSRSSRSCSRWRRRSRSRRSSSRSLWCWWPSLRLVRSPSSGFALLPAQALEPRSTRSGGIQAAFVGWVERSETYRALAEARGWVSLRSTHPTATAHAIPLRLIFRPLLLIPCLTEIPQIRRLLALLRRHQEAIGAEKIVLLAD